MHRYPLILALYALGLTLSQGASASTSAFEKAVQHADAATPSSVATTTSQEGVPAWLVGAWVLVRCDNVYPDGRLVALYGPDPEGLWVIDAQGHYMMQMMQAERGRFTANDPSQAAPGKYPAVSLDMDAHYGWVRVDGARLHTHIARASLPDWDGRDGSASYKLEGNQLTYSVAQTSGGASEGARGVVVWRRLVN